ncbi:LmeA family phospholipid-binding protein [Microbacterium sp. NPDC055903]
MSDDNPTLPYPEASTEHPTLVIPGEDDAVQKPRRRRWPWVVLTVVILLAALVVAAEFIARSMLPGIVRGIVIEQLELPADQQLDVDASGILLPQLIAGSLDQLNLSTQSVTVGGITGAAEVTARGVSLRGEDLAGAEGTLRIDQAQFETLLAGTDLPIESISFEAPDVTASGSIDVLGFALPISFTATPGATEGDLTLTPVRLLLGGVELDAAQIADRLGDLGDRLTETQRICIADQLPAGLHLAGLAIDGTEAVVDLTVDGAIISDASLQENGTCE